jgi:hypothetical protein
VRPAERRRGARAGSGFESGPARRRAVVPDLLGLVDRRAAVADRVRGAAVGLPVDGQAQEARVGRERAGRRERPGRQGALPGVGGVAVARGGGRVAVALGDVRRADEPRDLGRDRRGRVAVELALDPRRAVRAAQGAQEVVGGRPPDPSSRRSRPLPAGGAAERRVGGDRARALRIPRRHARAAVVVAGVRERGIRERVQPVRPSGDDLNVTSTSTVERSGSVTDIFVMRQRPERAVSTCR